MTRKQLLLFVRTRNKSGFASNLQFQIDANDCGFSVDDLGPVQVFTLDGAKGYQWKPEISTGQSLRLIEFGKLYLEGQPESAELFERMNHAEYSGPA